MEQQQESSGPSPQTTPFVFRMLGEPLYQPSYVIPYPLQQSLHETTLFDQWLKYLDDEEWTDERGALEENVRWRIGRLGGYLAELMCAVPEDRDVRDPRKLWMGRRRKTIMDTGAIIRWLGLRADLLQRQPFGNGQLLRVEHYMGFNISRRPEDDLNKMTMEKRVDSIRDNVQGAMKYVSGIYDGMLLPNTTTGNRTAPFHYPEQM